ncbi:bacillithiol system redox-active protein YtxJ [Euzebyella marina]|uniref:Bacillithiol system redox-active protein YtxJ n=1 Tax=Euzebyella marina TaxID=1761453 RepID=A0A3G2L6Q1_9FLAO|nr:bacillithiol system redox-active protein YtxJ [Euzebyella marina]AYN67906.1 bacillithiol system redox-active protein YtxJ [Euzebyella marina]
MGLFGSLFGGKGESESSSSKIPWVDLKEISQLEEIKANSFNRPQIIFKHSTTCGISRMVLNMFTKDYTLENDQMDFYFLDLQQYRPVSNEVAHQFNVVHQSPQLLIIKDGAVVAHDSHGAITDLKLEIYI